MSPTIFDHLDAEWPHISRTRAARDALRSWAMEDEALAGYTDLGALAAAHATAGPGDADRTLAGLARRAPTDRLAARVVLQLLLPGCRALTRVVPYAGAEPEERAAAVVAAAFGRIRTYPIERRPARIALNVMLDTRKTLSARRSQVVEVPMSAGDLRELDSVDPQLPSAAQELLDLLIEAVELGRLDHSAARLIALTRICDRSCRDIAEQHGTHPGSIRRRRHAAERSLIATAA
jgi:DNA-directed RNA polymerase specialized sigma24 family protein